MSCLWKTFQCLMWHHKTLAKKALNCFGFQDWDINISDISYKIKKVQVMVSISKNHFWSYTFLNSWALWARVTPCHASLLNSIPLMSIASLNFNATSTLYLPRGISFIIDYISETISSPFFCLFSIVASRLPVLSIVTPVERHGFTPIH